MRIPETKGISLSIRTIVLLTIGIIVLLATVSLIAGQDTSGLDCHAKLESACLNYIRCGCCSDDGCPKCSETGSQIFSDYQSSNCMNMGSASKRQNACCS